MPIWFSQRHLQTHTHKYTHLLISPSFNICQPPDLSFSPSSLSLRFWALGGPTLHAEVLCEVGGEPEGGWRVGQDTRRHGWGRRGQVGYEVGRGGDDLLLAVAAHLLILPHHRLIHSLHWGLQGSAKETPYAHGHAAIFMVSPSIISSGSCSIKCN